MSGQKYVFWVDLATWFYYLYHAQYNCGSLEKLQQPKKNDLIIKASEIVQNYTKNDFIDPNWRWTK